MMHGIGHAVVFIQGSDRQILGSRMKAEVGLSQQGEARGNQDKDSSSANFIADSNFFSFPPFPICVELRHLAALKLPAALLHTISD